MKLSAGMAIAAVVCVSWACGSGLRDDVTPTEAGSCRKVAGAYVSTYGNSCSHFSSGDDVTLTQSGCTVGGLIPGVGTVTGTITDDVVAWKVDFGTECKGTGTGTGKIEGTRITGTYSGVQTGASCCAIVTGTFMLVPK